MYTVSMLQNFLMLYHPVHIALVESILQVRLEIFSNSYNLPPPPAKKITVQTWVHFYNVFHFRAVITKRNNVMRLKEF